MDWDNQFSLLKLSKNYIFRCFYHPLNYLIRLYNLGYTTNLTRLYPKIEYPVKRGTGMISPFIKWNHDRDWYCPGYTPMEVIRRGTRSLEFAIVKEEYQYLMGHIIDGE